MSGVSEVVARVRRPEYTGENRCVPCTVVNVVVAVVLGVAVGARFPGPAAPTLGAAVLLVSLGAIYLRGYLVPGTPWFTRTYFPDWLLRRFEKGPASAAGGSSDDPGWGTAVDVEAVLVRAGVLTECEDVEDLCTTPAFKDAWDDRIAALRTADTAREDLASTLGVHADALGFEEFGDAFVARHDGQRVGQWESRAAFLADVASAKELERRVADWSDLDLRGRSDLLRGLRLFLSACPACGGPVAMGEDVAQSCCRTFDVAVVTCTDCGSRLFEAELTDPG